MLKRSKGYTEMMQERDNCDNEALTATGKAWRLARAVT